MSVARLVSPIVAFSVELEADIKAARIVIENGVEPLCDLLEASALNLNIWISEPLLRFIIHSNYRATRRRLSLLSKSGRVEVLIGPLGEPDSRLPTRLVHDQIQNSKVLLEQGEFAVRRACAFAYPCRFPVTVPSEVGHDLPVLALSAGGSDRAVYPINEKLTPEGKLSLEVDLPYLRFTHQTETARLRIWLEALSGPTILASDLPALDPQALTETPPLPALPPRLRRLIDRFLTANERLNNAAANATQRGHIEEARRYLSRATSAAAVFALELNSVETSDVMTNVISADVELDYAENPEVDPTIGWARLVTPNDGLDELITVDTQLARFYLQTNTGILQELDYKPRRVDLALKVADGSSLAEALRAESVSEAAPSIGDPIESAQMRVMRSSPDFLTTRFIRHYSSFQSTLDLHVKAGIGAFQSNATTGFEVEYWLDNADQASQHALLITFRLPADEPSSILLKPLTSAGGVSQLSFKPQAQHLIRTSDIEGGLHGVRTIDGLNEMSFDVRSAKQLNSVNLRPIFSKSNRYLGTAIELRIDARRISGDERANTVFISFIS